VKIRARPTHWLCELSWRQSASRHMTSDARAVVESVSRRATRLRRRLLTSPTNDLSAERVNLQINATIAHRRDALKLDPHAHNWRRPFTNCTFSAGWLSLSSGVYKLWVFFYYNLPHIWLAGVPSAHENKKNANKAAEYNVTTDVLTVLFFARLRIYFRQCLNCQGHCADWTYPAFCWTLSK